MFVCEGQREGIDKIILQNVGILQIIGTWEFIHLFSPLLVSLIKDYLWMCICSNKDPNGTQAA